MKTCYGLVLVAMLAGCSGQESQDPAPQAVVAAPDAAALQKAQYQAQQAEIAKRLEGEEYFIGENTATYGDFEIAYDRILSPWKVLSYKMRGKRK